MERSILAIELCQVSWQLTGLSFLVGQLAQLATTVTDQLLSWGLGVSGKTSDEVVQAVEKLDRNTGNSWTSLGGL